MTARSLKALSAAAALVVLVACQSQTQGQGGPASSPNLPTTTPSPEHQTEATIQVQFRRVMHSAPYGQPSPTLDPSDPSRLVRSWFQPDQVEEAKSLRQPPTLDDLYALQMAIDSLDCRVPDPLAGLDEPGFPLVTCDQEDRFIYALEPSFLDGTEIESATAEPNPQGIGHVVVLTLRSAGAEIWREFTAANVGRQVAFVVNTDVISAPEIQEAITDGTVIVSGGGQGGFTQTEAGELATRLASS